MRYVGTAVSMHLNLQASPCLREWQKKQLAAVNAAADEVVAGTLLIGVHTKEGVRVKNPNAVDPRNEGTYFVELQSLVLWPVGVDEKVAFCHLLTPSGLKEIFLKTSGVTSRIAVLAEGVTPKKRASGKFVRLQHGDGEILHRFISPEIEDTFVVPSEAGKAAERRPLYEAVFK